MNKINPTDNQIIKRSLKLIKKCPVCNRQYLFSQAQLIEQTETEALVYFSCDSCHSSLLAKVINMPFGVIGSAMLTDLEAEEVLKFKKGEAVNVDDVLEVYQRLES